MAAAVSAALALFAWRRRPVPGAVPFAWLMLAVTEWTLGYTLELGGTDLATKVFWANVQYLGIVIMPMAWLVFVLQYARLDKWLTRRNLTLLAIEPLAMLLLVWTNEVHNLIRSDTRLDTSGPFSTLDYTYGVGFWGHAAYSYLLILLCTLLLIHTLSRSPRLYRGQTGALLIGALAPWVGNALYIFGLSPLPRLDLTPFAFILAGLAIAWGLFRFRLLDIIPVARDIIIEGMTDSVIVLDAQARIVDLNPAAERIIGHSRTEVIGQSAAQVLSGWPGLVERCHDVTEAYDEITLGEGATQQYFDLRVSSLHDRRGRLTGHLVVLRDITERKWTEELLQRERETFFSILQKAPYGVLLIDQDERCLYINPEFTNITGHTLDDIPTVAEWFREAYPAPAYRQEVIDRWKGDTAQRISRVFSVVCKEGKVKEVEFRPTLLDDGKAILVLSDITKRKQTEERLRTRGRFLECLSEVSQQLLRASDLTEVLPAVMRRLGKTINVSRVYLFESHPGPEGELLGIQRYEWCAPGIKPQVHHHDPQNHPYIVSGFACWAEILKRGGIIAGTVEDLPESERAMLEFQDIRTILVIPLFVSDAWYGFIGFDVCDRMQDWQQVEIDLLRAAASDIASVIEREQARCRTQALVKAAAVITSTLDFDQVLDRILEQVGYVVPNDAANIMLIEGGQARIARWRGYEQFSAQEFVSTVVLQVPEMSSLQQVMDTGEPMVIPDTATYPGWVGVPAQEWLRSYASAPIVVRGQVIGFLNVDSAIPGFFSQAHLEPLRAFAGHAAAAIENARLFRAEQQQTRKLVLLADIARIVATTMDANRLLRAIAESIHCHFAYPIIEILTLDDGGKTLTLRGHSGISIGSPETITPGVYRQSIEQGIIGHVARTGKSYSAPDVRTDPYFLCTDDTSIRSELCIPTFDEGHVIGVINVESDRLADFDEEDQSLLEAVADTVAIGLRHIHLYEEAQRRVRELTLLNRISAGLGAALNVDTMIDCALEGLHELVGADRTYFITIDPKAHTWETTHELVAPGIRPATALSGIFDGIPNEMETFLTEQPFAVFDITTDPRVEPTREMYRSLGVQSVLLTLVRTGRRLHGILGFGYCRQKHTWQSNEIRLLEGAAHQLELAMDNARLFEEARLRADDLATALARQEELDRLKDEFIQNVSHELRTPLALIRGYAEMLDTGKLGEIQRAQRRPVAIIARRARMLSDLVQGITLILEAKASPPVPAPVPVPVDELTRAAVEDFQMAAEHAELTLHAEIPPHLPPVSGSHTHLRRVLDNLLGNAIKFTPAGGTISVRVQQEGEQIALKVSDTGIGIPADRLERIFERFYQVDGSARRRYNGVGLGLALVKEIIETYNGRVTMESQVGEGSTFTVFLPIAADADARREYSEDVAS